MFYLVDPSGKCIDFFAKNLSPQQMADRIIAYMEQYKKKTTG